MEDGHLNLDKRVALYPFKAESPDELTLEIGDIVTIISIIDDAWFECQLDTTDASSIGLVPCNILSTETTITSASTGSTKCPSTPSQPATTSASSLFSLASSSTTGISEQQPTAQAYTTDPTTELITTELTTESTESTESTKEDQSLNESSSTTVTTTATTTTASSLISTSLVTTTNRDRSSSSDSSYAQGERMAAALVSTIANNKRVQQAASLAKTGMVTASNKVRAVSTQMQASYKVGRDKATSVTGGRGSRSDTAESKEAAVNYVADFLESDTTKAALTAGAHVAAAFAGSKVGMSPSMTSLAASGVIETAVDTVQDASVGVAKVTVNALHTVVPDAVGIVSGVTYAMADTALRESTGAIHGMASMATHAVAAAAARTSSGEQATVEVEEEGNREDGVGGSGAGPEFEVMTSEESGEEMSDLDEFEDAQ